VKVTAVVDRPELCLLRGVTGIVEPCPGEACAFWEDGGAVVSGGCAIERLGLDRGLERAPEMASWLLDVRDQLERASSDAERLAAHRSFQEVLAPGLRD
jgi:hypothetical protein